MLKEELAALAVLIDLRLQSVEKVLPVLVWLAEDTLTIVRLVIDDQAVNKFWTCPWCNFMRDGPSPLHAHFERKHASVLAQVSRVAYLRCCADKHGHVRAFLSGPNIGQFNNPRDTRTPVEVGSPRCSMASLCFSIAISVALHACPPQVYRHDKAYTFMFKKGPAAGHLGPPTTNSKSSSACDSIAQTVR